ncbi:MAG: NADH dehydrogenase [Candidatus Lambdaproteobacteria bacterium RIFOXYD1_FULL_56_27]|uniref:NADH dehydrogenase n=1 Tax=Candidatus Lambdaproteobacteria bacterium RIFOXYD2_FULL_56_26 TaxID=1817773 RepID=A0A1F6GSS6_9PROT|nr:MAG: NADH dehydrogenase [Candidatus Lambdaproteobacteria bacterium RIFOXYC1_FULL_56_13]OGH01129.1 MAG: NADH dehydrogenase [Candidatus Lambdaproteobacteria bacterium RIFOXYD2_FULL_56_26]OGH06995.1 MAG: NADH dehydrogenase [Candidatus Lambdaproteobacteria bacterium RIFOXYD1_FULL_56_27]
MNAAALEIIIGEGTCGIAAGAVEVTEAFKAEAPTAKIRAVSCAGMCHQEVLVEVNSPKGYYKYGKVTKKEVPQILGFLLKGESQLAEEFVLVAPEVPATEANGYMTQQTRIALRNVGLLDPTSLEEYEARDGYKALRKILGLTPQEVINEVKDSGIRGRGGAGFPSHMKWSFAAAQQNDTKYLICNGDEGDPGAFMDRSLLEGDPHNVIEGMLIAAYAIGATHGYAYIRAEYPLAVKNFGLAIKSATAKGYLGNNILGSSFNFEIKIKEGAGAFVCGEETALMASIEGERGMPRRRPPFPAVKGLFGKPTIINNVETLSNLPWILNNGGKAFAAYGTEDSKGTKVFALAGAIKRGGLVEVPMGTKVGDVIYGIGGGSASGRKIKGAQLGGPSGGCIPASLFDTPIEYAALQKTGAIVGSGGMIVFDDKTCMVDLAKFFLQFTQLESCGKCTFCRIGTLRMKELLTLISEGKAKLEDLDLLEELCVKIVDNSLCALGGTAPNPVLTTLRYFKEEYIAHIVDHRCPAGKCKALITHKVIQSDCTGCSLCEKACPTDAITGEPKVAHSYQIDMAKCINCSMCVEVCKPNCILVE